MSWKKRWPTKERQDGHEPPEPFAAEKKIPSGKWRKKYECKKNKGSHTFKIVKLSGSISYSVPSPYGSGRAYGSYRGSDRPADVKIEDTSARVDVHWECSACKKQQWEIFEENPRHSIFGGRDRTHKKMDPYRKNIYETLD